MKSSQHDLGDSGTLLDADAIELSNDALWNYLGDGPNGEVTKGGQDWPVRTRWVLFEPKLSAHIEILRLETRYEFRCVPESGAGDYRLYGQWSDGSRSSTRMRAVVHRRLVASLANPKALLARYIVVNEPCPQ